MDTHERERMNEHRVRCQIHGTHCIVAQENGKKPTRRAKRGSHDARRKDHRRA